MKMKAKRRYLWGSAADRKRRRRAVWKRYAVAGELRCFFCTHLLIKRGIATSEPPAQEALAVFDIVRYPKTAGKGGRFTLDNCVPSCRRCSRSTSAKHAA